MVRPKKHLGQHFLTDRNIASKIVGQMEGNPERVCELGPGTGVLTTPLLELEYLKELILLEIDTESVTYLNDHFDDNRLKVMEADFLKTDLTGVFSDPFTLIGNFPYNISSQIFFKVLEYRNRIPQVVGMIQKEVAERIVAAPGSKTYGILSVLLQTWYEVNYCFTVNEGVFHPPPKVKSAVIRLERNNVDSLSCDEDLFFKVVKMAFGKRRKTLRNALRPLLSEATIDLPVLNLRAEQLDHKQFEVLTTEIGDH
jgi:16S rRNA (adenine1518-N6/adenine1519-N6)-dimethyltransferase